MSIPGAALSQDFDSGRNAHADLGRNSALIGLYTNFTFPQYGVRYIAINDNFDTIDPNSTDNDFAGIKTGATSFMREILVAKSALSIRQRGNAAFL